VLFPLQHVNENTEVALSQKTARLPPLCHPEASKDPEPVEGLPPCHPEASKDPEPVEGWRTRSPEMAAH